MKSGLIIRLYEGFKQKAATLCHMNIVTWLFGVWCVGFRLTTHRIPKSQVTWLIVTSNNCNLHPNN